MANNKKKEQVNLHLDPQVRQMIRLAAPWVCLSDTQFCIRAAYREAKRVLNNNGIYEGVAMVYQKETGQKWKEEEELYGPVVPPPETSIPDPEPKEEYAEEIEV